MARITSEIAGKMIGSKYDVVLIGARRARELHRGWQPMVKTRNDVVVTAIREIEQGKIGREYLMKPPNLGRNDRPPKDTVTE